MGYSGQGSFCRVNNIMELGKPPRSVSPRRRQAVRLTTDGSSSDVRNIQDRGRPQRGNSDEKKRGDQTCGSALPIGMTLGEVPLGGIIARREQSFWRATFFKKEGSGILRQGTMSEGHKKGRKQGHLTFNERRNLRAGAARRVGSGTGNAHGRLGLMGPSPGEV